jgi:hypothetical protein
MPPEKSTEEFLDTPAALREQGWKTDEQVYFDLAQLKEVMGELLPGQQVAYTHCDHPHVENVDEFRNPKGEKERHRFWVRSEIEDLGIPLRSLESCMEILAAEGREEIARDILAILVEGQGDHINYLEQDVSSHIDAVIDDSKTVYDRYPGDREFWKPELNEVKKLGAALGRKQMIDRALAILRSDSETANTPVLNKVKEYLEKRQRKDARIVERTRGTIASRLFYPGVNLDQYHSSTAQYLRSMGLQ